MPSKPIRVAILALILGAIALVVIYHAHDQRTIPAANLKPVPRGAPNLNQADIEKMLGVERFQIVRRTRGVPLAVQLSFTNLTGFPFEMADPGKNMLHDVIVPGLPARRLVFAGLSDDSVFLVYEQGGYVDTLNAVFFWFEQGGRNWGTTLTVSVNDVASLRAAIVAGNHRPWKEMN